LGLGGRLRLGKVWAIESFLQQETTGFSLPFSFAARALFVHVFSPCVAVHAMLLWDLQVSSSMGSLSACFLSI